MIFYFNSDGRLINSVPSNVYQGSNKASRIYFVCPTAKSNVISVAFTLPSGLYSSKRMLTRTELTGDGMGLSSGNGKVVNEEDVGFNVWQYDIPFSVTEYAGQVTVQFFIDDNTGTTVATQSVTFLVEKGSGVVDPNITESEYQEIVEAIAGYYQDTDNDIRELDQRLSQEIAGKQDALVSGENIKTINGQPILGAGDIIIQGGGGGSGGTIAVDGELSSTSTNPVENRVITEELNEKQKQINANQAQIQQLSQVLNTKPTTFTVSVNDTFSNGVKGAKWFDYDGNDITSQIGTGNYVDDRCLNSRFNSQSEIVSLTPSQTDFIITRVPTNLLPTPIKYIVVQTMQLANIEHKVIRIIEQEIPDRTAQLGFQYYEVKGSLNDYSRYSEVKQGGNWMSITNKEPFTYDNILPLGNLLTIDEMNNKKCFLTLINDQPLLFVKHGFQIQNIRAFGNVPAVDVLSVGIPEKEVTFTLKVEVIE